MITLPLSRFIDPDFIIDPEELTKLPLSLDEPIKYPTFMQICMQKIAQNVGIDPMLLSEIETKVLSFPMEDLLLSKEAVLLGMRRKEKDKSVRARTEKMEFYSFMTPSSDGKVLLDVPLPECRLNCCKMWSDSKLLVHFDTLEHCCAEKGASLEVAKWLERFCQKKLNHWRYPSLKALQAIDGLLLPLLLEKALPQAAPAPPRRRL